MITKILSAFALAVFAFLVGWGILKGIDKELLVRCEKLRRQSQEYRLFFLTQNEKQVCDELGIIIDAPIKNGMYEF